MTLNPLFHLVPSGRCILCFDRSQVRSLSKSWQFFKVEFQKSCQIWLVTGSDPSASLTGLLHSSSRHGSSICKLASQLELESGRTKLPSFKSWWLSWKLCWRTQPQIILANNIQYLFSPALWLLLRQSASSIKSCDIILKGNVLVLKWSGMYYDSLLKKKSCSLTEIKHMTASWLKAKKRIVWINHTCSIIPIPYFIRQWVPSYSFSDILQQK